MRSSLSLIASPFVALVLALPGLAVQAPSSPDNLKAMAHQYYQWRDENYPVASSDQGLHTWDDKLTDYSSAAIQARKKYVEERLGEVRAMPAEGWSKDDRIDWILFRSQLEAAEFYGRVLQFTETNPQVYTDECSNAIFSLLKKEYDTPRNRALSATARMKLMPALLDQGRE
ncbi:MAG TPA: DUF885 family protein, partial [Blastocatellia bacterium]|nr:DUF885 family protein [Blastocatellia bacterium]